MAWGSNGSNWDGLYRIDHIVNSYAQAVAHWNSITPWRGETETDKRPLTSPRCRHFSILHNEKRGVVELYLYNTPVITIFKNGNRLVKHGQWNSNSTRAFIDAFFYAQSRNGYQFLKLEGKHYAISADGILFNKDGKYIKGAVKTYTTVLDTTKTKKLMVKWGDKIKTCIAMIKLMPGGDYRVETNYYNTSLDLQPTMEVDEILKQMCLKGNAYDYRAHQMILEAKGFREKIRRVLYKQYDCYKRVAVPLGQLP